MSSNLPKPVPFRMKPKKKILTFKGRKALFYVLALMTVAYIVFSITRNDDKEDTNYQLASPNEFVGIKKGKTSDYDDEDEAGGFDQKVDNKIKGSVDKEAAEVVAPAKAVQDDTVKGKSEKVLNVKKPKGKKAVQPKMEGERHREFGLEDA